MLRSLECLTMSNNENLCQMRTPGKQGECLQPGPQAMSRNAEATFSAAHDNHANSNSTAMYCWHPLLAPLRELPLHCLMPEVQPCHAHKTLYKLAMCKGLFTPFPVPLASCDCCLKHKRQHNWSIPITSSTAPSAKPPFTANFLQSACCRINQALVCSWKAPLDEMHPSP